MIEEREGSFRLSFFIYYYLPIFIFFSRERERGRRVRRERGEEIILIYFF